MSFHGDPTASLKAIHYEGNSCMQYCCKDEVFYKLWLTTWLTEWVTDGIPWWLITCSGVIFEELIFPRQLKFSSYPRTRRLTYDRLRKSPPLLPIPRQMNSLYTPPSYPFKISFNIFLPSTIRSPKPCLSFRFPKQYFVFIYIYIYIYIYILSPHTCHMRHATRHVPRDHSNIWKEWMKET